MAEDLVTAMEVLTVHQDLLIKTDKVSLLPDQPDLKVTLLREILKQDLTPLLPVLLAVALVAEEVQVVAAVAVVAAEVEVIN